MRKNIPNRRSVSDRFYSRIGTNNPRHILIGLILLTALLAFESFNFDTTRYALNSFIGHVNFGGMAWATILAIAFCAIDFAGLARLFTPEKRMAEEPKEVWYLMGAWLLGATMNAVMTWWAVSLTLLSNPAAIGNEILAREQVLQYVPIFVAVLVWLTRILFIGSLTMAGEHFFDFHQQQAAKSSGYAKPKAKPAPKPAPAPRVSRSVPTPRRRVPSPGMNFNAASDGPSYMEAAPPTQPSMSAPTPPAPRTQTNLPQRRVQRPSVPAPSGVSRGVPMGMKASPRKQ